MPSSTASDRRLTARRRGDRGQAAVEFAVVLPVIVVFAFGIVVVAVAVRNELAVEHAAREGARAAAVSATPASSGSAAAQRAVTLPVDVAVRDVDGAVEVTVTHTGRIDVAIIGRLVGPVTHSATVTMALEPP